MPLLKPDEMLAINELALSQNLEKRRSVMLSGLDRGIIGNLELSATPLDQLWLDLNALNSITREIGGNIPLKQWLQVAEMSTRSINPDAAGQFAVYAAAVKAPRLPDQIEAENVAVQTKALIERISTSNDYVKNSLRQTIDPINELAGRLTILVANKRLHDVLHELQMQYLPIIQKSLVKSSFDGTAGPTNAFAQNIRPIERACRLARTELEALRDLTEYRREEKWIVELERIFKSAKDAADRRDFEAAKKSIYNLRRLMQGNMNLLDYGISVQADGLDLSGLVDQLRSFADEVGKTDDRQAVQLRESATRLLLLQQDIEDLVRVHGDWQRIDTDLWSVEDGLIFKRIMFEDEPENFQEFRLLWPQIGQRLAALAGEPPAEWYRDVDHTTQAFNYIYPTVDRAPFIPEAQQYFEDVLKWTRYQFRDVDLDLVACCKRVSVLARQLQALGGRA